MVGARKLCHTQCHVVQRNDTWCLTFGNSSFHQVELPQYEHSGTKGTAHTRLKEIRAKATVITLANFDVVRLKKISLEDEQSKV